MYADFYGLTDGPFQLTPDHRFFFKSRAHRKALAYLSYGLSKCEGFVVITGDVGAGKTTLIAHILANLAGTEVIVAKIVTSQVEADDLLRLTAASFGLPTEGADKATLLKRIETFLFRTKSEGRRACLVVDEAQSLAGSSIEELRMLSNFQSGVEPLLQIFLIGQPNFRTLILRKDFEQLRQRVVASYHLVPLEAAETRGYIEHRLRCVGWKGDPSFAERAFVVIHKETGGVPRRINLLCDRLLLHGYLEEKHHLDEDDVIEIAKELHIEMIPMLSPREPESHEVTSEAIS